MADTPAPSTKPKRKKSDGQALDVSQRLLALESRISDQDPREQIAEVLAQLKRNEALLLELRSQIPRIVAQTPVPLDVKEVAALLESNSHTKFRALTSDRRLRINPGDVFDPTNRFETTAKFLSRLRGGQLKVARAA